MSYTDRKITQAEINAHHVQGATDYLIGNAQQNKAVFDDLPEFIAGKFNDLIDEIAGQHGDEIKVAVDEWLAEHPEATTTVQDNSLTTAKYVDGSVTESKIAKEAVTPSKLDRAYSTTADLASVNANLTNELNVLDARMDEFASLPEGSTSGNAELLDIRVGADGRTYQSAGGAVRGQVADLKSEFGDNAQWHGGLFQLGQANASGGITPNGTRLVTTNILYTDYPLTLQIEDGYRAGTVYYDAQGTFVRDSGWVTGSYTVDKGRYIRFTFAKDPDVTSMITDFESFLSHFLITTKIGYLMDSAKQNNKLISGNFIQGALNYAGAWIANGTRLCSQDFETAEYQFTITPKTGYRIGADFYDNNNIFSYKTGLTTSSITIDAGAKYKLELAESPDRSTAITDFGGMTSNYTLSSAIGYVLDGVNDLSKVTSVVPFETEQGYIQANGEPTSNPEAGSNVMTQYLLAQKGDVFSFYFKHNVANKLWCVYALYDKDFKIVGSRTMIVATSVAMSDPFTTDITISDEEVKYIRFSYSTYNADPNVEIKVAKNTFAYVSTNATDVSRLNDNINSRASIVRGIGHRGISTAPENTLVAFKEAKKAGFNFVETDVAFTSDGVAVLLHDPTINRTARNADGTAISGTVNIADITYAQALEYDFGIYKGPQYEGTTIPTLEEFIALCRGISLTPHIELKTEANFDESKIKAVMDIVQGYGMQDKVYWTSFSNQYLEMVKSNNPKANLRYTIDLYSDEKGDNLAGLVNGQNNVALTQSFSYIDATSVAKCKELGVAMGAWVVDVKSDLLSLNSYVTEVTTDNLNVEKIIFNEFMN